MAQRSRQPFVAGAGPDARRPKVDDRRKAVLDLAGEIARKRGLRGRAGWAEALREAEAKIKAKAEAEVKKAEAKKTKGQTDRERRASRRKARSSRAKRDPRFAARLAGCRYIAFGDERRPVSDRWWPSATWKALVKAFRNGDYVVGKTTLWVG